MILRIFGVPKVKTCRIQSNHLNFRLLSSVKDKGLIDAHKPFVKL